MDNRVTDQIPYSLTGGGTEMLRAWVGKGGSSRTHFNTIALIIDVHTHIKLYNWLHSIWSLGRLYGTTYR